MNEFWSALHFLRPQALWLLLLLPVAGLIWWYRQRKGNVWRETVDAHLLPHLLAGTARRSMIGFVPLAAGLALAVLALAGPSWRQQEQPMWNSQAPLVAVLDLSDSVTATDLQPSRLLQARAKLAALLRERKGGEVALVVYAGDAFTVAPLTTDAANVALFLDDLTPKIIPVEGQHADRGIEWAVGLLQQAKAREGDILLISNRADGAARDAAARAAALGYHVSTLGLGTTAGSAYRDRIGQITQSSLEESSLRAVASAGDGHYATLTVGDEDLQALGVLQPRAQESGSAENQSGKVWRDEGYWLIFPVMLLALFAFRRRGGVVAMLALMCLLPMSLPAQAAESALWQRPDQLQHQQLSAGVDAYRKGDFAGAQRRFEGIDSDQGWYNLGNALAKQGKYDEAISAYDRALKHQPGMPDAVANRAAVDAARKRQQQQKKNDQQSQDKQQSDSSPSDEKGDSKPSGEPPKEPSSKQDAAQKPGEKKDAGKPEVEDAAAQQQADQAQREKMQQAMQQAMQQSKDKPQDGKPQPVQSAQERERKQAIEAWMQRVPDEPGSLLKTKFQLEYERRKREGR